MSASTRFMLTSQVGVQGSARVILFTVEAAMAQQRPARQNRLPCKCESAINVLQAALEPALYTSQCVDPAYSRQTMHAKTMYMIVSMCCQLCAACCIDTQTQALALSAFTMQSAVTLSVISQMQGMHAVLHINAKAVTIPAQWCGALQGPEF